jgi:hypothetical protein
MKNLKQVLWMCLACVIGLIAFVPTASAGGPVSVPEVDGSIAGSAVALLVGGYLVVVGRWRRK